MNIVHTNPPFLDTNDLKDLHHFQRRLEGCVSNGTLFFEDLEAALSNLYTNHKLTTQKLTLIRQCIWEKVQAGNLQLEWRPYKKS